MARTILIGLDGGTFRVFDPLTERGHMPFLASFMRGGARAELLSTANPLTPPAWTSLMTGRGPGHHGIFDFLRVQERGDDLYFTLHDSRDIRAETIWSILSRHGRRVAVLNFPLTAPPERVDGCIVPGLVSWKHLRRSTWPPELYQALQALPGFAPKEFSWDFDIETRAVKQMPHEEYEEFIRFHIRRERQWFEIAKHVMGHDPADVTAVLFDGTDKLQHLCWRFIDEASFPAGPSAWERHVRELCLQYFRQLDDLLAGIVGMAGPEARVFMASDHGFGPTHLVFRVNTWLAQQGYLTWRSAGANGGGRAVEQRLKSDVAFVDLRRTTAYARTSASNGIVIRTNGAGGDDYERLRRELIARLLQVTHPETGERVVAGVLTREEAFPGRLGHRAPDLTLVLADRGFVSIGQLEPAVVTRPEVAGTHRPEGIFLAAGPGLAAGASLPPFGITDVPAALLYSAGVPIPEDFEGRVPLAAFDPAFVRSNEPVVGGATRPPAAPDADGDGEYTPEDEAAIAAQLKALGYLD